MSNSMINPSIVDLQEIIFDRYLLIIVTAKRARQIIAGNKPLVNIDSKKPVTIAVNEIYQNKICYENVKPINK